MTFPNTPEEIERDSREREDSRKRLSEIMSTYNEIITELDARKEFLSEVAEIENADIAIDTISNISAVGSNTPQASTGRGAEEGNIEILSRLDTPKTIPAEIKEQKPEVLSLTDILANQPEEEAAVRQSKHIQSRNVEENGKKKKQNDGLETD